MKEPIWILPETVFALHERLLAEFSGLSGLRDSGLIQNHSFIDGNTRIGFTIAVLFIEINGSNFTASEAHSTLNTLVLAAGEMTHLDYADWLKGNCSIIDKNL